MDLSGNRGELPIPMHAANASSYGGVVVAATGHGLELQHNDAGHAAAANHNGQQSSSQMAQLMPSPLAAAAAAVPVVAAAAGENAAAAGKKRAASAGNGGGGAGVLAVKYRECLKNHAAAIGGNATDGCGEFMPSGEEGSLEALRCSACGCHRNFHRKDLDDDFAALDIHRAAAGRRLLLGPPSMHRGSSAGGGGLLVASAGDHYGGAYTRALPPPPPPGHPHQIVMPLNMIHSSESDEMDGGGGGGALASRSGGGGHGGGGSSSSQQKRFRTKFTPEQKARMLRFAEQAGWRLQRAEDAAVQRFCQEIGVKRRVLKVWMHNNKHNLATKPAADQFPSSTPPVSPQPHPEAQAQALPLQPMNSMPPPSQEHGPSSSSPPPQDQLNLE